MSSQSPQNKFRFTPFFVCPFCVLLYWLLFFLEIEDVYIFKIMMALNVIIFAAYGWIWIKYCRPHNHIMPKYYGFLDGVAVDRGVARVVVSVSMLITAYMFYDATVNQLPKMISGGFWKNSKFFFLYPMALSFSIMVFFELLYVSLPTSNQYNKSDIDP